MNFTKFTSRAIAAVTASVALGALAAADVGLVNQLQGDVSYQGTGAAGAKAAAFMKVREGDKFAVPEGGVLRPRKGLGADGNDVVQSRKVLG